MILVLLTQSFCRGIFVLLCVLLLSMAPCALAISYQELVVMLNRYKEGATGPRSAILAQKLNISWEAARKLLHDFKANGNHLEGVSLPESIQTSESFIAPKKLSSLQHHLRESLSKKGQFERKRGKWLPTAAQFSGAFQWAHKQGITGKGQTGVIFEPWGKFVVLEGESQQRLIQGHTVNPLNKYTKGNADAHHIATSHTLHQIAPDATIVRLPEGEAFPSSPQLNQARVINHSSGLHVIVFAKDLIEKFYDEEKKNIKTLVKETGYPKLFLQSSGNEKISLSSSLIVRGGEKVPTYEKYLLEDETLQPHLILVGSVTSSFAPTYTYPGEDKKIQNNFLCTLGTSVRVLSEKGHTLEQGTSLSSPIVAGAALLLMEKYPQLTIFQIKEVLLESAARSFLRNQDEFVYESEEEYPALSLLQKKGWKGNVIPFDSVYYGKGVLDLRAAFVYAELLIKDLDRLEKAKMHEKETPRKTPEQLRKEMQNILAQKEKAAATLLQRWVTPRLAKGLAKKAVSEPANDHPVEEVDDLYD